MDGDSPPHASRLGITQASLAEEDGHGLFGVGPARRPNHAGASKHASEPTGNAPSRQGINSLGGSRRGPRGPTWQTPLVPPTSGRTQAELQVDAMADPPVRRWECRRQQVTTICRRWNRRCIFHAGWRIDRKLKAFSEVRSPSCAITRRRPRGSTIHSVTCMACRPVCSSMEPPSRGGKPQGSSGRSRADFGLPACTSATTRMLSADRAGTSGITCSVPRRCAARGRDPYRGGRSLDRTPLCERSDPSGRASGSECPHLFAARWSISDSTWSSSSA